MRLVRWRWRRWRWRWRDDGERASPGRPARRRSAGRRGAAGAANPNKAKLRTPSQLNEKAPDTFKAKLDTSTGRLRHRGAPRLGAAWRRSLLQPREERVLRRHPVLPRAATDFMAQFGINGDPGQAAWQAVELHGRSGQAEQQARLCDVRQHRAGPIRGRRRCSSTSWTTPVSMRRASRRSARSSEAWTMVDKLYSGYGRQTCQEAQGTHQRRRQRLSC